jgi:tripartite-type tricarboxylate transporter receptor subunit TctC
MMVRPYCPTPDNCQAPKRGICPCQVDECLRARMSEARKKAWASPEVRARMSEARKKAWASPEVRARMSEARKKAWAGKKIPVPDHLKTYATKLRRNGIRGDDLRKALEAAL